MADQNRVNQELEHLFRREYGKIVSILTRVFGPSHIDLAENVVQEALLKATQTWPYRGIPENPSAWIMQVAKHRAIDLIRKDRRLVAQQEILEGIPDDREGNGSMQAAFENEIQDNQLRLMFICCHPVLSHEVRVALTLKTVCGFGVSEIARAFLAKEETIAQRLVRAKQKIREEKLAFELPASSELLSRLDSVLDTIYLLFNEGYSAHSGDSLIREDICIEACRLGELLACHSIGQVPRAYALLALMFLQGSRLKARIDSEGEVLLLADQDRTLWNQEMIAKGLTHLSAAAEGESLSNYHLLAGIAACHATAGSFDKTDWPRILQYYDELVAASHSPVIALNRAVALSFVKGPEAGLKELNKIRALPAMNDYYLLPATMADFYRRMGATERAIKFYEQALDLVGTEPEKRFLTRRLRECGAAL